MVIFFLVSVMGGTGLLEAVLRLVVRSLYIVAGPLESHCSLETNT